MKKWLKILAIGVLILMVLLIPLFGTYVATAQALPNEARYPIKQQAEKIIDQISLVNPTFYAYFSLLKAKRRYQEVIGLTEKNQNIATATQSFIDQVKQTLFDIQSVSDTAMRVNFISQYQSFISNAKENLSYKTAYLKDELGVDRSKSIKTFTLEQFGADQGRLVTQKKVFQQKGINEEEPVSNEVLIQNITELEKAQSALDALTQN
jgi:hypothetical protein